MPGQPRADTALAAITAEDKEKVSVATELVLLGTAGTPVPVAGRAGISSALIVDGRVFVIDCGRGSPSAFADAGLDFSRLEAVFLTHLHADQSGDLAGLLLYPWGVRVGDNDLEVGRVRGIDLRPGSHVCASVS
jgi:ribonuclease BN (tRNA processing enzyme)